MSATSLRIAGICERDLDLLMVEELSCNAVFRTWFLQALLGRSANHSTSIVRHSVTQSTGQSDLELAVTLDSGTRLIVLIENKVDASLELNQAERYRARAEAYLTSNECDVGKTLLVAPERYCGSATELKGFDHRLSYEQIRDWFDTSNLGDRAKYKAALLTGAIEKSTLGYQPVADAPVTDFWYAYWQAAQQRAPELQMQQPISKPAKAGFIYFRPPSLPKGIEICHKLPHGHIDLQINGWGSRLDEVHRVLGSTLEPEMSLAKASKSAVIRIRGASIDAAKPFTSQETVVLSGLLSAARLLAWSQANRVALLPFAKRAV